MAKVRIKSLKLDEELESKLLNAQLLTVESILSISFFQLMTELRLSLPEVSALIDRASTQCLPKFINGLDLLERERSLAIKLNDSQIDNLLYGGIRRGCITEFAGPSGVGKTQFCLQLSLNCLLSETFHNSVCIIDTEGAFRSERLLQMIEFHPELSEGKIEELTSKLFILQPRSVESLGEILDSLEIFCVEKEIGLVILDSVASLARKEFSQDANLNRAEVLAKWAAILKNLADDCSLAVVLTNQVTTRATDAEVSEDNDLQAEKNLDEEENITSFYVSAALGSTWAHFVNTRFILQYFDANIRELIIAKSPVSAVAAKKFKILPSGIKFEGELNYTFTGLKLDEYKIRTQPPICSNLSTGDN